MKKCYFVQAKDEGIGLAIIAETSNEAKKYGFYSGDIDCDWIWLRVNVCKDLEGKPIIPPDNLPVGHIFEPMEGLKLGVYAYIEDGNSCPICFHFDRLTRLEDGTIACENCQRQIEDWRL